AIPIPQAELEALSSTAKPGSAVEVNPSSTQFSDLLGKMVEEVNARQSTASQAVRDLQSGQSVSLHQAMIAIEEASISFQLMVEVRNKLLESYQELMRMQI
ncbi:MAG: flagellar hook-basal body complex protein FliE, partial [Candidatus Omnitrophica bacterium]|nr:flagellar hook-basal body complex protein FliE [Candidatus Omnitrophota bacterium]